MSNLFHRLYSTYVFEDGDRITHNESAYMRPIISVLDTPERTQSVGSPADSLAWGVLVSLDNLAVRARAFQAADLLASCRQNKSRHLSYGLALRERSKFRAKFASFRQRPNCYDIWDTPVRRCRFA